MWPPRGCRPSACRTGFWRLWGVCFPISSSCGSVQSHVGEKALGKERLTQRRTSSPLSASSYLLSTQFPASPNGPDLLITLPPSRATSPMLRSAPGYLSCPRFNDRGPQVFTWQLLG